MTALKKIAFFVEGQTEAILIKEMIFKYLGYQGIRVERFQIHGDSFYEVGATGTPPNETNIQILIMDCQGDGRVVSAIKERQSGLASAGYSNVIGVRDLYPVDKELMEEIEQQISDYLQGCAVPVRVFLAIMEIEAWLMSDPNFFQSLDAKLDAATIADVLTTLPEALDVESVRHPARLIDDVLQRVGRNYRKRERDAYQIVNAVNLDTLLLDGRARSASLDSFVTHFEGAFS